jgi:hypothetical protein
VPRAEVSSAPAYFEKKTLSSPNSITMCSLRVPEIIRGTMPPGTPSVEGSSQFMNQSNCHPWLLAIVDVKEDGLIKASVMNTLDQPITIQSGQQYGIVTLTCDVNEAHSFQALLQPLSPTPPCGHYRSTPYWAIHPPATRRRHSLAIDSGITQGTIYWPLKKSLRRHLVATV